MEHFYLIVTFLLCFFLNVSVTKGWTHRCPQTHLQLSCKCMPGEKCCFCPKPKIVIGHHHVSNGLSKVIENGDSPCSPLVVPNGCTVGGVCPPCNSLGRQYTNDLCVDDPSCSSMTGFGSAQFVTMCSQFADVRSR